MRRGRPPDAGYDSPKITTRGASAIIASRSVSAWTSVPVFHGGVRSTMRMRRAIRRTSGCAWTSLGRFASRFAGQKIHFIGIGGSGMSGLARMLLDNGAIVTGSEPSPNPQTFDLTKRGAIVYGRKE